MGNRPKDIGGTEYHYTKKGSEISEPFLWYKNKTSFYNINQQIDLL